MKEQENKEVNQKFAVKKEVAPVQEKSTQQDQPKKKKRIVIVGNPQNSKSGMNVPARKPSGKSSGGTERARSSGSKTRPATAPGNNVKSEDVAAKFRAALGEKEPKKTAPAPAPVPAPTPEPAPAAEEKKPVIFEPELQKRPFVKVEEASERAAKQSAARSAQSREGAPRREVKSAQETGERREGRPSGSGNGEKRDSRSDGRRAGTGSGE
ncbi:MAG: hypothetical protein LUH58_05675, partial [Lachnospiraceae bacterium]|nr:hypothetical protein [Lachnospiraceae bacterium]